MQKIAVIPGSFDPFTIGHESIVKRALPMFDLIYIAIGINVSKKGFFPLDKRIEWIEKVFKGENKIKVTYYSGLTVDYCNKVNAGYIVRGLRTAADFEYERAIGQINKALDSDIETLFLLTKPEHSFIASNMVRDIIVNGGNASIFLPERLRDEKFIE